MPAAPVHPVAAHHAAIDEAVDELRQGGGNALAYHADRDSRDVLLGLVLRMWDGRIDPTDERFPRRPVDRNDDRYRAAYVALGFDYDYDDGDSRRVLVDSMRTFLVAVDHIDGEIHAGCGHTTVDQFDRARIAWCAIWPALLKWRRAAELARAHDDWGFDR